MVSFCFSLPQYVYPSAYLTTPGVSIPTVSPHSPMSPSSASQFFDYPAGFPATAAAANQFATTAAAAAAYEAAYPFATTAGYVAPAAAYSYAVPQHVAAAGHYAAAFQPQQIQERMQ